jgi:hypothetical protein
MSRVTQDALIDFFSAAALVSTHQRQLFVQGATVEDVMRKALFELARVPGDEFLLTHMDLGGAGDGHTFVLHMELARVVAGQVDAVGVEIPMFASLFSNGGCLAADDLELLRQRTALQARLLDDFGGALSICADTILTGAGQGTRFMWLQVFGAP